MIETEKVEVIILGLPGKRILIIVENLPVPFDRRVWQEACSLKKAGYEVSIICPSGKDYEKRYEVIDGIYIYRHPIPFDARSALGYLCEYGCALFWEFVLSLYLFYKRGFDVIQACNPPDLIFIVGGFYKLFFGKKFVFDHHDINPELWLAKGGRKKLFYKLLLLCERLTFMTSDVSIATNMSYKDIAVKRGKMKDDEVFVVRSSPIVENIEKFIPKIVDESLKKGKKYMVGYVGVMAKQDGIDYLLNAIDYIINNKGRKDIFFVLIGKGPEWQYLINRAKELNLDNFVCFTGRISDKEMVTLLSSCDVCVNPDIVNEFNDKSTMNKIIEYMILAKPIVQFDMKEGRFSAQEASLYARPNDPIDFGDKILELLDDPQRCKTMSAFGKRRVKEDLSWTNSEKELLMAYNYLFSKVKEK
ncbi:MAG: glycosyltransferase family 4 protein [Candidatus Brocadia sp.]|nr:glycosyltransferase family 4 protein [Candidatus Brocadia sp.]